MHRWIRASITACILHLLLYPVLIVLALGFALSSFTNDSGTQTKHWEKEPPNFLQYFMFGGYMVSSWMFDQLIFGGPLPPEPINPDFSDQEKLNRLSDAYWPEYNRREWAYQLCKVFDEVAFGALFGGLYVIFFPEK